MPSDPDDRDADEPMPKSEAPAGDSTTETVAVTQPARLVPLNWSRGSGGITFYDDSKDDAWLYATRSYHLALCR